MITYNFRRLWRLLYLSLFKTKGTPARLTPKRIFILVGFYFLYTILEIITWFCFGLDRILYPSFLKVEVKSPVFIIGNPRSGTTFLHRLMARDEAHFSSIFLWEIIFAPSIVQRKIWEVFKSIDRCLGHPVRNLVRRWEEKFADPDKIHRIRLRMPEEDEYLMMHEVTTIVAGLFFGLPEASQPFVKYDECLSEREKSRAMLYYRRCIQRHLFCHGQNRFYLSKNPFFTPKVDTLLREFPDAFIIYLIRNPLNVVPSYASMSAYWWHVFCDPKVRYPYKEFILKTVKYWYHYPLTRLEKEPPSRYIVMRFDDMVGNPRRAVGEIYDHLGLELTPAYAEILDAETLRSQNYQSKHDYSLEEVGYTREQILSEFRDVFQQWQFDEDI